MDVDADIVAGRYELEDPLGRGGTSTTRAARDRVLRRRVAIKFFDPARWSTPEGRARFEIEARLAASVNDSHVVTVYDVGLDGDAPYLVMECLPGRTLADEIREGPLTVRRACDVVLDVLAGLAASHARGVIHRDLKPGNVLLDDGGRAKLADFGIATSSGDSNLTATGLVVGTPAYLSPERIAGGAATVRSDIYAVGVIAYEALTGVKPFAGDDPIAVAYAVHRGQPTPLRQHRRNVPAAVSDVVERAMAPEPEARFASANDFMAALVSALDGTSAAVTMPIAAVGSATPTRALPAVASEPMAAHAPAPATAAIRPPRRVERMIALAVVVLLLIVALVIGLTTHSSSTGARPATSTPSTAAPLPPALQTPFNDLQHAVSR